MTFTYAVNCSLLFTELPLEERAAAARQAGFGAVEFWWPWAQAVPPQAEVDAFVSSITRADTRLAGLNFWAGHMPGGDRGMLSHPDRSAEFAANVELVMDIARRTGCTAFNALYGLRLEGVSEHEQDAAASVNLGLAAEAAATLGGIVLLEPISGAPAYPLLTAGAAVAVIDRVAAERGLDNLRLLYDAYHLDVNGDDVFAALAAYYDRIGHVQIADNPGRHEPGTGALDIPRILAELDRRGWDRYVALEYTPGTTSAEAFDWLPPQRRGPQTRSSGGPTCRTPGNLC